MVCAAVMMRLFRLPARAGSHHVLSQQALALTAQTPAANRAYKKHSSALRPLRSESSLR